MFNNDRDATASYRVLRTSLLYINTANLSFRFSTFNEEVTPSARVSSLLPRVKGSWSIEVKEITRANARNHVLCDSSSPER